MKKSLSAWLCEEPHRLFIPAPLPYLDSSSSARAPCTGAAAPLRAGLQAAIHLRALTMGSKALYKEWKVFLHGWSALLATRDQALWVKLTGTQRRDAQRHLRCRTLLALEQFAIEPGLAGAAEDKGSPSLRENPIGLRQRRIAADVEAIGRIEGLDIGALLPSARPGVHWRQGADVLLLKEICKYIETGPDRWPLPPHWHVGPHAEPQSSRKAGVDQEPGRLGHSAAQWIAVVAKKGMGAERRLMADSLAALRSQRMHLPGIPAGTGDGSQRDADALTAAWRELAETADEPVAVQPATQPPTQPTPQPPTISKGWPASPLQRELARRFEVSLAEPGTEELHWTLEDVEAVRAILDDERGDPAERRIVTGQLLALYFLRVLYGALLVPPTNEIERNHSTRKARLLQPVQWLLARMRDTPSCRHAQVAGLIHARMNAFVRKSYSEQLNAVSARVGVALLPDAFRPHDHRRPLHASPVAALVGERHAALFEQARLLALNIVAIILNPIAAVDSELAHLPWQGLLGMLKGFTHPWRPPARPTASQAKRPVWPPLDRHDDGRKIYRYCRRMVDQDLRGRYRSAFIKLVASRGAVDAAWCRTGCAGCSRSPR